MNREEFKKIVDEKLTLEEGEFDKLWSEKEKETKEMLQTTDTEKVEKTTLNKLYVFLSKQLASNAEVYEGVLLGFGDTTDYGAEKKFNSIKETWEIGNEEVRKGLIKNGEVDESGNPLWNKEIADKAPWKYQDNDGKLLPTEQRRIDLEKEKQKPGLAIAKKNGDETFYKTMISLWSGKLDINTPLFRKVKFRMTGNLRADTYKLNSSSVTEFVVLNEEKIPLEELNRLLDKYFSKNIVDLNEQTYSDWIDNNQNERVVILKNCIPTRITMTTGARSNVVNIGNPALGFEDDSLITCWVSKSYEMNVAESDSDVMVIGQVNKGLEGNHSVNVFSFYNPNKFVKPEPVNPEKKEEPKQEEKREW